MPIVEATPTLRANRCHFNAERPLGAALCPWGAIEPLHTTSN